MARGQRALNCIKTQPISTDQSTGIVSTKDPIIALGSNATP